MKPNRLNAICDVMPQLNQPNGSSSVEELKGFASGL